MDRRGFIQKSAVALAAGIVSRAATAQQSQAAETAPAPAKAAPQQVEKLKVDAYSRHLQWLRTPDEVAEATIEMAYTGVDITVRPYPGHVDPSRVATDLPPFVKTIRDHGLEVRMITCPITDADSPNAEAILQAASSLGIRHYWWGTFRYDQTKPVIQQLDELKPRVEKLAKLNEKYKMKALYHTYSMPGTVGCNVWDFLNILRNFDPAYVAFHWDVGHTSLTGGNGTWVESLRASAPYIGGLSVKEYTYELDLKTPGGGPFTGNPAELERHFGGFRPGGPGGPGRAAAEGAGGAASRPRSAEGEQQAAGRGMGAPAAEPQANGANAGQRSGAGSERARQPGEGAGPGSFRGREGFGGRAEGADYRGGGGQPLPWRARAVPLGEGINNLPLLASILKEIQFQGPVEIQSEYPNGGAESAKDKITLPRIMVLGAMKRDLLTLKAGFAESELL